MKSTPQLDSPFMQTQPLRFSFSTLMIMLLMVVGAGVGLLLYYALQVPAITAELYAWLGLPNPVVAEEQSRAAHVKFLLVLYSAPLLLGLFVYCLHYALSWVQQWSESSSDHQDDAFRMN